MVRLKNRYLLCELCFQDRANLKLVDERAVFLALKEALSVTHGDYGSAIATIGFVVKYLNAHTGVFFLRCRKSHYRLLWSALPFVTSLGNRGLQVPCSITCLHVGGTIRTCQKFLVRYNIQQLHRMLSLCQSEAEKSEVRKALNRNSLQEFGKWHGQDEKRDDTE